jgi:preprotein translocase subunit SecG
MEIILLVVHMLLAVALIGIVLIQRSEGGALGIGGGGGGGMSGFLTGRATANLLTRATAVLAALFFITSLGLTWLSGAKPHERRSIVDQPARSGPAVPGHRRHHGRRNRQHRAGRAQHALRAVRPTALMPAETIFEEAAFAPPLSLLLAANVLYGVSP